MIRLVIEGAKECDQIQFSSFLFSQNIIQYRNTYTNYCKLAREPRRNQKAYEAWVAQSQRNKENEIRGVIR